MRRTFWRAPQHGKDGRLSTMAGDHMRRCPTCGRQHHCRPKAGEFYGPVRPQSRKDATRYEAALRGVELDARIRRDKGLIFALHCDGLTNAEIKVATGFGTEKIKRLLGDAIERMKASADRRWPLPSGEYIPDEFSGEQWSQWDDEWCRLEEARRGVTRIPEMTAP